jgi:hypothetical protein
VTYKEIGHNSNKGQDGHQGHASYQGHSSNKEQFGHKGHISNDWYASKELNSKTFLKSMEEKKKVKQFSTEQHARH